jgi:hypothetical protein
MKDKPQIIIIGPYPLPIGGISVHVERLASLFESQDYKVKIFDDYLLPHPVAAAKIVAWLKKIFTSEREKPVIKKRYEKENIAVVNSMLLLSLSLAFRERKINKVISYHAKNWKYRTFLSLAGMLNKNLKIVYTIHSLRDEYGSIGILNKLFVKFSLKKCSCVIATSEAIKAKLLQWVPCINKITVQPAFLPPQQKNTNPIADNVLTFLEKHDPIIAANASHINFYEGSDMYGIDMCIDLCASLKRKMPGLGMVFGLPMINNTDYYRELNKAIKEKNIQENFLFVEKPCDFYPVISESDIFVRPTNTDGDAVSVRESIYLKVPVVASDAAQRPAGTVVFKSRDNEDFALKVETILNNYCEYKTQYQKNDSSNEPEKIIQIFEEVIVQQNYKISWGGRIINKIKKDGAVNAVKTAAAGLKDIFFRYVVSIKKYVIIERDLSEPIPEIKCDAECRVRMMKMSDIDLIQNTVPEKKKLIQNRLEKNMPALVAINKNNELMAYYFMAIGKDPNCGVTVRLKPDEGVCVETLTIPKFRGLRIASLLKNKGLLYLKSRGCKKVLGAYAPNFISTRKDLFLNGYKETRALLYINICGLHVCIPWKL